MTGARTGASGTARIGLVLGVVLAVAACGGPSDGAGPASRSAQGPSPGGDAAASAEAFARTAPHLSEFSIGGDFELTSHTGTPFRLSEHRGEVLLMFFGYTSCPDFCPTTMSRLAQMYRLLGQDAARVQTLFVTIDPERDTPDKLAAYLGYFSGVRAIGLTGSHEQIDAVAQAYAVRYEVQPQGSAAGPLFAHTTYVYLIDPQGRVRYTFTKADPPAFLAAGVRELLDRM